MIGIQHSSPGFATVAIAPKMDGLYGPARASGRFTSARGEIAVAWGRSDSNGSVSLHVSIPTGVSQATVLVPPPFGPRTAAPPEVVCAGGSELGAKKVAINSANELTGFPKIVHLECKPHSPHVAASFA